MTKPIILVKICYNIVCHSRSLRHISCVVCFSKFGHNYNVKVATYDMHIVTVTYSLTVCIKLESMCNNLYTVSIVSSVVIVPSWSVAEEVVF